MRSNAVFWGVMLVLLGGLLLLSNLGIITVNVWGLFWPILMIIAGLWIMQGVLFHSPSPAEEAQVPLDGASQAQVALFHAAGCLDLGSGAGPADLLVGSFGGGLDLRTQRRGSELEARLQVKERPWTAWTWRRGEYDWRVLLNENIPLELKLETGASNAHLNLENLCVTDLKLSTGASDTHITLPSHAGFTRVHLGLGAASVKINVPEGVAARVRSNSGLASISVDANRFPAQGGVRQSPDFDTADNKVEIEIEAGAASVEVR